MRTAYDEKYLYNLLVVKESRRWSKNGFIENSQFREIAKAYPSPLYHPNFTIRILLFCATLLVMSGVSGLFFQLFYDVGVKGISIAAVVYGIGTLFFLQRVLIRKGNHYKSGVTEGLLYHGLAFCIGGIGVYFEFEVQGYLWVCLILCSLSAFRYLDLISTLSAVLSLAGVLFYAFYNAGGLFQQVIPFVFIVFFTPVYFFIKSLKARTDLKLWANNFLIVESLSLLLIYLAGNYFVVRELSVNLMQLTLAEGEDIPFAPVFYALTALMPILYMFFGIRNRDVVLIRVSLVLVALSVFTFKYYYGFERPEITLTIAGAILLIGAMLIFRFLKEVRHGFTRENLLSEKWGDANVAAFVMSQTLGGNQVKSDDGFRGGGGDFGGGGATGSY